MGMLMHHTWLNQQEAEKANVKPIKEPAPVEEQKEEPPVKEPEPVKKTAGRRKVSK